MNKNIFRLLILSLILTTQALASTAFQSKWLSCKSDQDCILLVGSGKEKHAGCRWLSVNKSSKRLYRQWETMNEIVLIGSSCTDRDFEKEILKLQPRCVKLQCEVRPAKEPL